MYGDENRIAPRMERAGRAGQMGQPRQSVDRGDGDVFIEHTGYAYYGPLLLLLWGIPHLVLWFAGEVFCEYCRLRAQTAERVSLTEYLLGEGVREKLRRMAVRHAVTGWVVMLAMLVLLALLLFLELGPSLIGFYTVYN